MIMTRNNKLTNEFNKILLLIEDNDDTASLIKKTLLKKGFDIIIEKSYKKAIAHIMDNENWDTGEASLHIANDEGLYLEAMRLARRATSISNLSESLKYNLSDVLQSIEYCNIDIDAVDWDIIAEEYIDGE